MARSRTTFKPGQVTNPKGRPRTLAEVQKLARKQTKRAVEILADAMENATRLFGSDAIEHPDYRVKVAAADALLNRGWGTPHRAEETQQSDADKARILSLQAQKLEAETRLLEQKIAAGDLGEGDGVDPSDEAAARRLRERFGEVKVYPTETNGGTHH